ncbi:hypothetical protein JCM19232_2837 [Vibrio ishigakensis]|uniref:Uncharacterized protein n=1 Tax=Vibrio ishigakensis TaxID=1481914 RepID=A0A0B8PHG4_9VIBR|nr:hypothetical protein JCM19232_2837 [Vibrio ishigakensis]
MAVTEAKVVSAPYHRNIRGNKLMIDTFLDTDIENVKGKNIQE